MFQFLNPIWLFAAAAVVVPVAIHLWNIRPGKVLKVGSISLMNAASRKSSRSFKLLDILLFILRCLLLILLALLLAIPIWQKRQQVNKVKGWILVPKENFGASYKKFKPTIDSLTNAGYEFHFFNSGFPKTDIKQILTHPGDAAFTSNKLTVNYWNLVRQLDTTVSSTLPVYIFTTKQASYFIGQKPQVALNLRWQTYIPADSTSTWIAGAWFNNNNTIRILQGNSKPSGTTYSYATIQSGDQPNSLFNVNMSNGLPSVSLKTGNQQAIKVDTGTFKVAVYAGNNMADANYLKAALQAVSQFMQRKAVIKQYNDPRAIPTNQDWVFWLSDQPVNHQLLQLSSNLLVYQKGKIINSNSWINNSGSFSVSLQQGEKVALFKLTEAEASPTNYQILWRDGFGNPILSMQKMGETNIYHFYSRFNPTWNDLVWSSEFPSWLLKLIVDDTPLTFNKNDKRVLDQQQLMPDNISKARFVAIKTTDIINMANYCWLMLALLFFAERWLANRIPNITTNG